VNHKLRGHFDVDQFQTDVNSKPFVEEEVTPCRRENQVVEQEILEEEEDDAGNEQNGDGPYQPAPKKTKKAVEAEEVKTEE
jgi:hypothetical protein